MGGEDEGGATLESVKAALRRLEAETDGDAPVPTSHGS
jgi:hypothetical protein